MDFEFEKLIRKLIGVEMARNFAENNRMDYTYMMRSFELAKRSVDAVQKRDVLVVVPISLRRLCESNGTDLEKVISDFGNTGIVLKGDRIALSFSVMDELMQSVIKPILQRIQEILRSTANVGNIILVGGFAESSVMCAAVRNWFGQVNVTVAPDPGTCVLKGAVLFGFAPNTIISRIMQFTYGLHRSEPFQQGKHNPDFKFKSGDMQRCENIFEVLVTKDTSIPVDHVIERRSKTLRANQESVPYNMYVTKSKSPVYVTEEGCSQIGSEQVQIDRPGEGTKWFRDRYMFGDTEIRLEVKCEETGKKWNFTFRLHQ